METVVIAILLFIILGMLVLFFKMEVMLKQSQLKSDQLEKSVTRDLAQMKDFIDTAIKDLQKTIDDGKNQAKHLSEVLTSYESESSGVWLESIKKENSNGKKLGLVEGTIRRFPEKRVFIEEMRKILGPLAAKEDNLLVRREALMRLRESADLFLGNCKLSDLDYALGFQNEVTESMEDVVKKIDELRQSKLNRELNELEEQMKFAKMNPNNEEILRNIEKIDHEIEHQALTNYPDLKAKYERLSQNLLQILREKEGEDSHSLRVYNKNALEDAKRVMKLMENHSEGGVKDKLFGPNDPVNFNERKHLIQLVKLITKYNPKKLLPSTSNFMRISEADVFNKLSSDGKVLFTELMIQEAYKS